MQIFNPVKASKYFCDMREERASVSAFRNVSLNVCKSFALACLHSGSDAPSSKFYNMKAFFLESSTDNKIKSVSTFMFSLQAPDIGQTYISGFYEEENEELLKSFIKKNNVLEDHSLKFNWFDHEVLVPQHPRYRDKISDSFYCLEGKLFDYRVFNVIARDTHKLENFFYSRSFAGVYDKRVKKTIYRNRFFKRKFS
jgi:hypothetical protein